MTKKPYFWLGLLLAATTFGVWWGALRSNSPALRKTTASRQELPVTRARAQQEIEGRPRMNSDAPPETDEHLDAPRRPHPITPLHEAMAERRNLLGAVQSALAGRQYEKARSLLAEASNMPTEADGSAFSDAVRGYRLILDCLTARHESDGGSSELPQKLIENAKVYLDQQRLPPRREVRRVCLEGRPFARRA